jgi:dihydropteroate synthase
MLLNLQGNLVSFEMPIIMAILNITPNSFFDGGKYITEKEILIKTEEFLNQGASIIDVGGCSTKPGSVAPSIEEETERVKIALTAIKKEFPNAIISIDTYRSKVATIAKDFGAHIINDISGGDLDSEMFKTAAELKMPYVLMHLKGIPQTMQQNPTYENCTKEVAFYFSKKIAKLIDVGVKDIIVDPGFGFGKSTEHNFELLRNLNFFSNLGFPLLAGLSRKSMISKSLNIKTVDTLNGTTVLNTIALQKGVSILRVHDVWAAKQAIELMAKL